MPTGFERIVELTVGLLFGVALLTMAARRFRVPYPSLLVLGGVALSFIPHVPQATLPPELVLLVFLPPLIFSAGWETSWRDLSRNGLNLASLAVGLVLATTLGVGAVLHLVVRTIPWGACFTLGAIVSPTDPIAVNAIASKLPLPHRLVTLLESESLANDATGLVVYRFAVAAVLGGTFSAGHAALAMVGVSLGGALLGLAVGWLASAAMARIDDARVEIALQLVTAYAAYLPAEKLGLSGVFAAAVAGLWVGRRSSSVMGSRSRLQASAFWNTLVYLINGVLFLLLGLQIHALLSTQAWDVGRVIAACAAVIGTTVALRFVWIFAFSSRVNGQALDSRLRAVMGWAGMRGVLSVATALALPLTLPSGLPFPDRELIALVAFAVVIVTLVGQGLSLPALIGRLGISGPDGLDAEAAAARMIALRAAVSRIAELTEGAEGARATAGAELQRRLAAAISRVAPGPFATDSPRDLDAAFSFLQRELIDAERTTLLELWRAGKLDDHSLRRIERDLDLQELRL